MDQAASIWQEAEDAVRLHGDGAFTYLCEQAEVAKLLGDVESAISYWDIALASVEVMKERRNRGGSG